MANLHEQAKKVGKLVYSSNKLENKSCPCCNLLISKSELRYFCKPKELNFLGPGYSIFFKYIKFLIEMLLIIFFFSGFFALLV